MSASVRAHRPPDASPSQNRARVNDDLPLALSDLAHPRESALDRLTRRRISPGIPAACPKSVVADVLALVASIDRTSL